MTPKKALILFALLVGGALLQNKTGVFSRIPLVKELFA